MAKRDFSGREGASWDNRAFREENIGVLSGILIQEAKWYCKPRPFLGARARAASSSEDFLYVWKT
jgi:hypothetical protein